jgi:hypothetical protein
VSFWGSGRIYSGLGREGGLDMRRETPQSSGAEVREEIRQMLEAKSRPREAPGEQPHDVEGEQAALTSEAAAAADPGLREEVRQLVVARNERRRRQGRPPLDVEAEVERQLRALGDD